MSKERSENINEAKNTLTFFTELVKSAYANSLSWDPQRNRKERTRFVLAGMSYLRIIRGEHVFLNTRYLESVVRYWKEWESFVEEENNRELINMWIRTYEQRIKSKKKIGEIGERFVDLSSSEFQVPISCSFILEYEASPYWGAIIYDFRKLLGVLAPLKVGVFHLPKYYSTSKFWSIKEKTGEIIWENKILSSDKPDELIEDMKSEIRLNTHEHPYTIYLIILIHSQNAKPLNLHGYLLWKETTGEVHSEKL